MCEIYLASHGDTKLHDGLLNFFKENFDSNITSVSCERCRGMVDKCWTSDCHLRTCATEQGLKYCFECNNFVCEKLVEFAKQAPPHHANIIENLKKRFKKPQQFKTCSAQAKKAELKLLPSLGIRAQRMNFIRVR